MASSCPAVLYRYRPAAGCGVGYRLVWEKYNTAQGKGVNSETGMGKNDKEIRRGYKTSNLCYNKETYFSSSTCG